MIIITDAHISKANGNHTIFSKMLESFEKTDHDIIFLGDIFDLWIAIPRYEEDIHRNFIAWCHRQKKHRTIGFMEGNHEFYLANERASDFTWCCGKSWMQDAAGIFFVHGDQINREDKNYLGFRKLVKNKTSKFILRYLPFGPKIALLIKQGLKKTNSRFRFHLPEAQIKDFAQARFADGANIIFVGHFHRQYLYRNRDSRELHLLPDWFSTQKITVHRSDLNETRFIHWEELE